jgi:hypothetical protein
MCVEFARDEAKLRIETSPGRDGDELRDLLDRTGLT